MSTSCGWPALACCAECCCSLVSAVSVFFEKNPIIHKYSPPPRTADENRKARREVLREDDSWRLVSNIRAFFSSFDQGTYAKPNCVMPLRPPLPPRVAAAETP